MKDVVIETDRFLLRLLIESDVDINNTKAIGAYSKAGFNFEKKYVEIIDTSHVSMVLNIL